ncbi:hypothetical protein ETD83_17565 [Actinomadura soli]|uniref:XRE family transcriptional regulator n=1 Tax=Actinomadura soli TaxID=2508997 RepID=A0A5C4JB02_9ACTN|nr:hypothetical protein [Actinomadura soli]TMR00146.1 hypothetical protein ETD83_17565 [Actinomadura soli]
MSESEKRPEWAVRLEYERTRHGWGKWDMSRQLFAASGIMSPETKRVKALARQISRWEAGQVCPWSWGDAIADLFGIDPDELLPPPPEKAARTGARHDDPDDDWGQVSELLRRVFMKRGIAVTALPALGQGQGRRVVQALDILGGDHHGAIADGLGQLIDHYALTICALPPTEVYDELLAVRAYAKQVHERAATSARTADLSLASGWLSHLLAVAACDMGEHAAARLWCSDAERRSEEARHPDLAAWSVLTRAMIAFYQGHAHLSAALAACGQQTAPVGTVVHAKLASQEMRAAAMVGDDDRMTRARRHAATAISALPYGVPETGVFSIALAEDPPYTATSLLLAGRPQEAVTATRRVIGTVYRPEARQRGEHPSGYARSLLILGLAHAQVRQLDQAVAAGHDALGGSRPAWPTMVLAKRLDRVLAENFAGARQAADYRARYLEASTLPGAGLQPAATDEDPG